MIFRVILTKGTKIIEKGYQTRARVSISSDLIPDLLLREINTRRHEYSTMKYCALYMPATLCFVSVVLRQANPSHHAKKKLEKRAQKQGIVTWREPFQGFSTHRELHGNISSRAISREEGESGESAKLESKMSKGCKRGHCPGLYAPSKARRRKRTRGGCEGGRGLKPGTQPFIYLASRPRVVTRRVRELDARFPHFDRFHPKFSAGTFCLPLTDLHNILEILYKIFSPFCSRRLSSWTDYC